MSQIDKAPVCPPPHAGGAVVPALYAASIRPLEKERLYAAAYAAATPARREKTDRFRFPEDRRRSLGAEALLRYGLRQAGVDPDSAVFALGQEGKPFLEGSSVEFNLSHSGDWVLCAVASRAVGCDVEQIGAARLELASRCFCREEYDCICAEPDEKRQAELFCRFWTLKESFLKAVGRGLTLPLDSFRIRLGEPITVEQRVSAGQYTFREFALPGSRGALCAEENCEKTALQIVSMEELL